MIWRPLYPLWVYLIVYIFNLSTTRINILLWYNYAQYTLKYVIRMLLNTSRQNDNVIYPDSMRYQWWGIFNLSTIILIQCYTHMLKIHRNTSFVCSWISRAKITMSYALTNWIPWIDIFRCVTGLISHVCLMPSLWFKAQFDTLVRAATFKRPIASRYWHSDLTIKYKTTVERGGL